MKKITVADSQGFCWGVRRALEIIEKYQEVFILGDLIHNKQVVTLLEKQNKKIIHEITDNIKIPVVITAHGTDLNNFKNLEALNIQVVDTTCPLVSKIYHQGQTLEQAGYQVIIFGDQSHVEIQGITSRLHDPIIINHEDQITNANLPQKVGVICQSTFSSQKFDTLVKLLKIYCKEVKAINTICSPTLERQKAAEKLACQVDIMIVIGGYHSSNTKKLYQLSQQHVEAYHIEKAEDLKTEWFVKKEHIGITAGASTPEWIINHIKEEIKKIIYV